MAEEREETLVVDKLTSGDQPSILMFGLVGAQSIRKTNMAVFMVDALGRVRIMPPSAVKVLIPPLIDDSELDALDEDEAIQIKVTEGQSSEEILEYLKKRNSRTTGV
jgi:hypothetical protein